MRWLLCVLLLWCAAPAAAQVPLLDLPASAGLRERDRANIARFLTMNLPRVLALGPDGAFGWHAVTPADALEARALESCQRRSGGVPCWIAVRDLAIVAPGQEWAPPPPPATARLAYWSHETVADGRFLWWGEAQARGVLVWAHGRTGGTDLRGNQPQSWIRRFNNAGYDVWRFDRDPRTDSTTRAAAWLRDDLAELRRRGYRRVIVAGQSRGGWNAMMMLDTPGLADVVVAIAPAAHGSAGEAAPSRQLADTRALVGAVRARAARLAVASFRDDPFDHAPDQRPEVLRGFADRLAGFLLIDRPEGLPGHGAGATTAFNDRFGACLLRFGTATPPPDRC